MKAIALFILTIYQTILSPLIKTVLGVPAMCRYSPSCSEYARIAIVRYGVVKGSWLGFKRLLTCHPFAKPHHTSIL